MKKKYYMSNTFGPSKLYNTAVEVNGLVFISGMGPTDPESGLVEKGNFEVQMERVLKNLGIILNEMGLTYSDVIKTNIYMSDMNNFELANKLYTTYFTGNLPARTTVQVACLPENISVEIEMVAAR